MLDKTPKSAEEMDKAGGLVLRAAVASEAETDAAATSPFLFTRTCAAIAEEKDRRAEAGGWLSMLFVARRAVPGMVLVTLLVAIVTIWSAQLGHQTGPANFDEETLFGTPSAGGEQTVLA